MSKPVAPRGHGHPVDVLFSSLAADQRERAIAIVLSGTGSNGTEGLKEIRAEGGMSLVQATETAKFDGMPRSAISAGMADHILAPAEMPEVLLAYIRHGYVSAPVEIEATSPDGGATLAQVLELLRARGGHDFRGYKHSTLGRRVHRRMGLRNIETLDEYLGELRVNPDEVVTLAGDLMISVTGFFRDAEAWKALAELVIAPIIAERESGASIRIWTPACSTGEEAYSVAMLVMEQAEAAGKRFDLKVFATDAQEDNLRKARDGIYPAAAVASSPAFRLKRFFEKLDGSYQVSKELRDTIVFAAQNLLRDPPFSRLDLVSCRNVLIYLEPDAQQRIIALCHFALRQGGRLFLGNAETIGRHEDLFETVSKKWRIYRRLGPTRHDLIDYPPARGVAEPRKMEKQSFSSPEAAAPAAEMARRALLERYAPASVLIDHKGRVLYFHGTTRDYLEHPPGEPTRDLLTMARDGLASKLRTAIREASRENRSVTVGARLRESKTGRSVAITVMPLPATSQSGGFLLVSFAPVLSQLDPAQTADREDPGDASSGERALQEELKATRAELQNTIEHMETTNEELKASNEEATSMNEELQSTNEELETSKEELQSFNEELNTVNSQLQHKIGELESTTNDLNNLMAGSETATLFLDTNFRIRWFAPTTRDLFDLAPSDVGRPIAHFAQKFADENLLRDAETVLNKLCAIDAEVLGDTGRWYMRRMLPYRTLDNRIAGIVITFTDITERRHATERMRLALEAGRLGSWELDLTNDTSIRSIDHDRVFGYETLLPEWGYETFMRHVLPEDREEVDRLFRTAVETRSEWHFECRIRRVDGVIRWIEGRARPAHLTNGKIAYMLGVVADITERKHGDRAIRESEKRLQDLIDALPGAIYTTDAAGLITSFNPAAAALWGRSPELGTDEWCGSWRMYHPDGTLMPHDECPMAVALKEKRQILGAEAMAERPDGVRVPFLAYPTPLRDTSGVITGAVNMLVDITERKRAEQHREILVGELNHRVKNTLAVVQSIASQTLGHAATMEEARESFTSRLINLAKAHDVLTRESWAGANLVDIVTDTVEPHAGGENRFRIEGQHVRLTPSAALAVGMALHELATNAAKYGALTSETGHVDIVWRIEGDADDRRLKLLWTESGGPQVAQPTRKGFGSRLIERALAAELGGKVSVTYEPSGVVCTIDAPMPPRQEVGGIDHRTGSKTDSDRRG
jgi:PAS domain S-box-containing protein